MATTPQPNEQILGGHSHHQQNRTTHEHPLLSARVIGQGTRCVVMLPGWFGDHNVYQPMFPYLDTEAFTYVFVDFRGYGQSRGIAGSYTTNEMVADVVNLMDSRWVSDTVQLSRAACAPPVFEAYLRSWALEDCSIETYGCTVPLLLLIGQHDPAQTLPMMDNTCLKWFVNVEMELLEGCGHYPMQEIPLYLAGAIERFLRKQTK
jgi:pimeloyl-ACP methyl ester carboxylesterase